MPLVCRALWIRFPAGAYFCCTSTDAAEEIESYQGRLASLEGEIDRLHVFRLRGQVLANIRLERGVGHPPRFMGRVERPLGKVETVTTIQVADRANRLGEHVQGFAGPADAGRGGFSHSGDRTTVFLDYDRPLHAWQHIGKVPSLAACNRPSRRLRLKGFRNRPTREEHHHGPARDPRSPAPLARRDRIGAEGLRAAQRAVRREPLLDARLSHLADHARGPVRSTANCEFAAPPTATARCWRSSNRP